MFFLQALAVVHLAFVPAASLGSTADCVPGPAPYLAFETTPGSVIILPDLGITVTADDQGCASASSLPIRSPEDLVSFQITAPSGGRHVERHMYITPNGVTRVLRPPGAGERLIDHCLDDDVSTITHLTLLMCRERGLSAPNLLVLPPTGSAVSSSALPEMEMWLAAIIAVFGALLVVAGAEVLFVNRRSPNGGNRE